MVVKNVYLKDYVFFLGVGVYDYYMLVIVDYVIFCLEFYMVYILY